MWTEITKDLVIREAIDSMGYACEETDDFFYVMEYLQYEDVLHLVEISDEIRRKRKSRIREIEVERKSIHNSRPQSAYDDRYYEHEVSFDSRRSRYLFATLVSAQNITTNNTAASTFYLAKTETQFSVNVADDSDDVFIYFASPAYSWVGVGFGGKMEDSLMVIMYQNADGNNVTVSPRIGSKASEPSFNSSINLTILPGTTVTNDSMLVLRAKCSNCRSYIDTESTAQPMIYAFGKAQNLRSNSPSAHLQRHIQYGHFTMDMTAATGAGGVPAQSNALNGVGAMSGMVRDHDRANLAHTILGCLAIFLLWPLNVLVVAFSKNIKIHIVLSVLIVVFLLVSFVLGGVTSSQYTNSKAFNTPHQIFAILSLIPLLGTTLLPTLTRLSPKNLRPLHAPLASASFLLLVLTGGLGLHLSAQPTAIILVYTAISPRRRRLPLHPPILHPQAGFRPRPRATPSKTRAEHRKRPRSYAGCDGRARWWCKWACERG
ncbi:DoH domain containing protein [Pyrenophora tritici-repentis]|nr:DoH domain containing protein [Pyrenophora tritici-repentis]